jgi:short-subunit dehydrogenase
MIVITGASDGLGLQLAKLYKESGKKVVNISRTESKFADVNIVCDLSDQASVENAVKEIVKIHEPIDSLINCAGILSIEKPGSVSPDVLERVFKVNALAPIVLVSKLYDRLVEDKCDIVNVSSTVGTKAYPDQAAYGSSKWAIRGFSQNLQVEFKDLPNRVISFCPGGFKTQFFKKGTGVDNTGDGPEWMRPEDLALFMKQILDLPKNMEVSEVVINRKAVK